MSTLASISILIADDDATLRPNMRQVLQEDGYQVQEAENARHALQLARHNRPDVIILDTDLPDMNGFEVCTRLRSFPFVNHAPILFLSNHHSADYIARALDCGGDDLLRKPFVLSELTARIRALVRRSAHKQFLDEVTLRFEQESNSVVVNKQRVFLTPTEFSLLVHLCENPTEHHTANTLLETLWQYPPGGGDTALVRNHIRNLRRKIEENPDQPRIIISMHGRGYTVNARIV